MCIFYFFYLISMAAAATTAREHDSDAPPKPFTEIYCISVG